MFFSDADDLFQSVGAVLPTGFIVFSAAVTGKTDQIFVSGFCHFRDHFGIVPDEFFVKGGVSPAVDEVYLCAVAQGKTTITVTRSKKKAEQFMRQMLGALLHQESGGPTPG